MRTKALLTGSLLLIMIAMPAVWGAHQPTCVGAPALCMEDKNDVPNNVVKDVWAFAGVAGTAFEVKIDTVAFATAFDPWARICTGYSGGVLTGCFASGDDNFACSHPPPAYSCPRIAGNLPPSPSGLYYIHAAAHPCCFGSFRTPGIGEYSIEVVSTGALLTLVDDNAPGN
jgi:hypothetical protein